MVDITVLKEIVKKKKNDFEKKSADDKKHVPVFANDAPAQAQHFVRPNIWITTCSVENEKNMHR